MQISRFVSVPINNFNSTPISFMSILLGTLRVQLIIKSFFFFLTHPHLLYSIFNKKNTAMFHKNKNCQFYFLGGLLETFSVHWVHEVRDMAAVSHQLLLLSLHISGFFLFLSLHVSLIKNAVLYYCIIPCMSKGQYHQQPVQTSIKTTSTTTSSSTFLQRYTTKWQNRPHGHQLWLTQRAWVFSRLHPDSACCPVCIMEERLTWVGLAGEGLRRKAGRHWLRKSRAPGGQRLAPLQ